MSPDISVVIPTYNRSERLPGLMATLEAQTLAPERFEVLVIDNGSSDDTPEVLAKMAATSPITIRPLRIDSNNGPAAARNLGWREARSDVVAYTDDDVLCDPQWLAGGLAAMIDEPSVGVLQGTTNAPDGTDLTSLPHWTVFREIVGPSPYFEACNIFYRRQALEDAGGFDEEIGWWGEDTSTGWNVIEAGWGWGYSPDARVVHPLEFRGPMDFVRNGYREKNIVQLGLRHPGFREEAFWRPWSFRKRDAAFAMGVASLAAGIVWRPALFGVLPYLWWTRPLKLMHAQPKRYAEAVVVDAARSAGHLVGSWKSRGLIF